MKVGFGLGRLGFRRVSQQCFIVTRRRSNAATGPLPMTSGESPWHRDADGHGDLGCAEVTVTALLTARQAIRVRALGARLARPVCH